MNVTSRLAGAVLRLRPTRGVAVDSETGKIVDYAVPMAFSKSYDVWPDREDACR